MWAIPVGAAALVGLMLIASRSLEASQDSAKLKSTSASLLKGDHYRRLETGVAARSSHQQDGPRCILDE